LTELLFIEGIHWLS